MTFDILFSGDTATDVRSIYSFIEGFARKFNVVFDVNGNAVTGTVQACTQQFPWDAGSDKSSPFKKAAAFTSFFIAQSPIASPLPLIFDKLTPYTNAVIAYCFSIKSLHYSTIYKTNEKPAVLDKKIRVSRHYFNDLILCLSSSVPVHHCDHIALIYESLAYRWNPDASYTPNI